MTNESKNTATAVPWELETAISPLGAPILFAPNAGHVICSFYYETGQSSYGAFTNFEANAAHIVKCVNAHDDLVAALEAIVKCAELIEYNTPHLDDDLFTNAKAALKKASE